MKKIKNKKIVEILQKMLLEEDTTNEEQKILAEWRLESVANQTMFDEIMDKKSWNKDLALLISRDDQAIWNKIAPQLEVVKHIPPVAKIRKSWYNYAVAASLIGITLFAGTYYLNYWGNHKGLSNNEKLVQHSAKVPVDGNKAFLELSDGSIIYLDDAVTNEELAREGESKIVKLTDSEIVYDAANPQGTDQLPLTINILSIPKGARYKLVLQDGSKVWLNAASSLRFPSSFNGGERSVELTGEAYFEIATTKLSNSSGSNSRVPFTVKVNGMNVEVLGTSFNVMAYSDEMEVKTTLLEGAVRISSGADVCLLKPGQEAMVSNQSNLPVRPLKKIRVIDTDPEQAIAWKNGLLQFNGSDIDYIMRKISRWYGVEVTYRGDKPQGKYSGKISLKTDLSEVVVALKSSGIQSQLEKNRIVVFSE